MPKHYDYERISDAVGVDDYGTIRIDESFRTVAIYIKVDDDRWLRVYVNPRQGDDYLVPRSLVSDRVAGSHRVMFAPKSVG